MVEQFLRDLYPVGPWVLTAIDPDKKGIVTETFTPETVKQLHTFIEKYNKRWNIYYSVNPPTAEASKNKKISRENIESMNYLHVDLDARVGEDLDEELERLLNLITTEREDVPLPTFTVYSGGGYQALWKLKTPFHIGGEEEYFEEAKRYNQQLELIYGGDNTHNVDRILRLPGTWNVPNEQKRKKGRKFVQAELTNYVEENVYPLTEFRPAPLMQKPTPTGPTLGAPTVPKVDITNVQRVEDLEELNIPDRVRIIIAQGQNPDEPKEGDNSRSAWLFDCICNLHRCDISDDVIYSIITDPEWKISESVLDKGRDAHSYAIRQIERGKDEAVDPTLRALNERYAVIQNYGGRCRIIEERMDHALKRPVISDMAFTDFHNAWSNQYVEEMLDDKLRRTPAGRWWTQHPRRRTYESIAFLPGQEIPEIYNLWKGFSVLPRPSIPPNKLMFLEHIRDNICQGNEEYFNYVVNWMANAVQKPDSPGQVAIVLQGDRGAGKSFFAREFGALFGRHYLAVADAKHLVGNFNKHLRDCVVLFADEAFYANDHKHESVLKTIITEDTLILEGKGIDATTGANCTHLIMASNNDWVVSGGAFERRFFVLRVGSERRKDTHYFKKVSDQLKNGGRESLLHFLQNHNLSDFDVRNAPTTEYLQEQIDYSLGTHEEWWFGKLLDGKVFEDDDLYWPKEVKRASLHEDYYTYVKLKNERFPLSKIALGRFLHKVMPNLKGTQIMRASKRQYVYYMPTLDDCRKGWIATKGDYNFPEVEVQQDDHYQEQDAF